MDFEMDRFRMQPVGLAAFGGLIALLAVSLGWWWLLLPGVLCAVPAFAPRTVLHRVFRDDEEWIARIKLAWVVIAIIMISTLVGTVIVIYSGPT